MTVTGSSGDAIGVVVDRSGRAVIAFSDGVLLVREPTGATGAPGVWLATRVRDDLPESKPGSPPAVAP